MLYFKNPSKSPGTGAVESISLDLTQISELYISLDAFTRMPELKLLKFYFSTSYGWRYKRLTERYASKERKKVKIICEGLESLPDELRYLCWHGYPLKSLPLKFNPEHLVDLEMPYSKLQSMPLKDTKFLWKLRRIGLSECRQLTEVPDLSQATNLVSMNLGGCSSLTKFPNISSNATLTWLCLRETAIAKVPYSATKCLRKIVSLDISFNRRLRNLPSMRHLTSLKKLDLNYCSNITEFPDVSRAITELYLCETSIEEVPYSAIKSHSKIVVLDMRYNTRLMNLPSMRHLTSLRKLALYGCSNITEFPDVPEEIVHLYLINTGIEEVPFSAIKCLSKIDSLYISFNTRLGNLPSMRHLTSLKTLYLDGCSNITEFPDVSGAITHLRLKEVPYSAIKSLSKIVSLDMRYNTRPMNLPSMRYLTSLHKLDLHGCSNITEFPDVPEEIVHLYLTNTGIEEVPYSAIKCLSKIDSLVISFNTRLGNLPNMRHLTSLKTLNLNGCSNITEFSDVSGAITHLWLSKTAIKEVPYSAIKSLSKIVSLDMSTNTMLRNLPSMHHLTSLHKGDLHGCSNITEFPDVPEEIVHLYLTNTGIEEVPYSAIKCVSKIDSLVISFNIRLENLPSMRHLTSLKTLYLDGCSNITEFPDVSEAITHLRLSKTAIEEVPYSAIKSLRKIVVLDMRYNTRLRNLPSMRHLTSLHKLDLHGCSNITEFPDVLEEIVHLYLTNTGIEEVPYSAIKCLSKIDSLVISFNTRLGNLPSMRHLTSLKTLYLDGCSNITEFPDVSGAITHLRLSKTAIEDVPYSAIKSLSKIVVLDMSYNTRLGNLPSMRHLTSLKTLNLDGCSNITEFPDVPEEIVRLCLTKTGIEEVPYSAIKSLSKIGSLVISFNTRLWNLPSMRHLTSLKTLILDGYSNITEFPDVSEEIVHLCLSETGIEEVPSLRASLSSVLRYKTLLKLLSNMFLFRKIIQISYEFK
ncbi:hypothetical protein Dsin_032660 [Dipteronia sinensis]|uniref:Chaoptin n=1 Tax=Dipteronia sinensis TaxID=43782 RepID=A0AAD9Z2N3_9ROSI|nr:hypothetical protein Dsin_032660 [Dipteronia sinensis]